MNGNQHLYQIRVDPSNDDHCILDEPQDALGEPINSHSFIAGTAYVGRAPASVAVYADGPFKAFNLGAFDTPIVSGEVAAAFEEFARDDVQLFPVQVTGADQDFYILNITRSLECIDEQRSELVKWSAADGRPEKNGQYRMVTKFVVIPQRATNFFAFRIKGWEIALVVCERLRDGLLKIPNLGVRFERVS